MAAPYTVRRTRPSRWRRVVRRVATLAAVVALTTPVVIAAFVGTRCYGGVLAAGHARHRPAWPGICAPRPLPSSPCRSGTSSTAPTSTESSSSARRHRRFPTSGRSARYWGAYGAACDATRGRYPFELGYHVMLGVIGVSFTAEYGIKALYENTVGRATEWLFSTDTPEDVFAAGVAREYGAFMHTTPWYRFPFLDRLGALWADVPWWGPRAGRKWERRVALSLELGAKGAYGWLMGRGSQAAYAAEDLTTFGRIPRVDAKALAAAGGRLVPSADPMTGRGAAALRGVHAGHAGPAGPWSAVRGHRRQRRRGRRRPCSRSICTSAGERRADRVAAAPA